MVEAAPNYIGRLRLSQLHLLFDGFSQHEKRKADAMKKAQPAGRHGGTRREAANLWEATKVPGVKRIPRKRKK
jgi:hypothetical protein